MDDHKRLPNVIGRHKEMNEAQCFYCCSIFHSHSKVKHNRHNLYPNTRLKRLLAYRHSTSYLGIFVISMSFMSLNVCWALPEYEFWALPEYEFWALPEYEFTPCFSTCCFIFSFLCSVW